VLQSLSSLFVNNFAKSTCSRGPLGSKNSNTHFDCLTLFVQLIVSLELTTNQYRSGTYLKLTKILIITTLKSRQESRTPV